MKRAAVWRVLSRVPWRKIGIFVCSVAFFILALELMKTGARGLAPLVNQTLRISNPFNGLGFGWLSAYLVMSGSPVAAAALTFFDAGIIDRITAFAMITGSRLGASLIVLLLGLLYVLRGHERFASLTTGLLALNVTAAVYLPALPVGYLIMSSGMLDWATDLNPGGGVISVLDLIYGPPVELAARLLPEWGVFLLGLGIIIGSFNLFDKALPDLDLKDTAFSDISRLLYRPIVTFGLGLLITFVTMSVSVSIGLLVPLSARGYIRRENLVPYIMGCNISTFIDTLVAGLLLRNPGAAAIVLAEILSVLLVSLVILVFFFSPFERALLRLVVWLTGSRKRLAAFLLVIFVIPVVLLFVR